MVNRKPEKEDPWDPKNRTWGYDKTPDETVKALEQLERGSWTVKD